jgi:hypothetical protein
MTVNVKHSHPKTIIQNAAGAADSRWPTGVTASSSVVPQTLLVSAGVATNQAVGSPTVAEAGQGVSANNLIGESTAMSHGQSWILSADQISFGTKPAQAPAKYDPCDGAVDSASALLDIWDYAKGYPEIVYKNSTYRSVDPPHPRMAGFMVGGMTSSPGSNVHVTVIDAFSVSAYPADRYWSLWRRADPAWISHSSGTNCGGDSQYKPWQLDAGLPLPQGDTAGEYMGVGTQGVDDGVCFNGGSAPPWTSKWNWQNWQGTATGDSVNIVTAWVHHEIEIRIDPTNGFCRAWEIHPQQNGRHQLTGFSGDTSLGITVGQLPKLFHQKNNDFIRDKAHENYMYYADLMVDSGFNRVVIGNSSVYASCTHLVPQPYTSWSASAVTLTVDLGTLTSGTNYLYFVDETGVVGGPLTIQATSA